MRPPRSRITTCDLSAIKLQLLTSRLADKVTDVETMPEIMESSLAQPRFRTILLGVFAASPGTGGHRDFRGEFLLGVLPDERDRDSRGARRFAQRDSADGPARDAVPVVCRASDWSALRAGGFSFGGAHAVWRFCE